MNKFDKIWYRKGDEIWCGWIVDCVEEDVDIFVESMNPPQIREYVLKTDIIRVED